MSVDHMPLGDLGVTLRPVPGIYAVARLEPDAAIPAWFQGPGFAAMVRAGDETTLVCLADRVPDGVTVDTPWACFRSVGPFDFQATGIVSAIVAPLSAAGLGVFVLCTFDGEHVLVAADHMQRAKQVLTAAGHHFAPAA